MNEKPKFCEVLRSKKEQRNIRYADELKKYRKANHYLQRDLAKIIGISQATIAGLEQKYNSPSKKTQEIIFQKLGIRYFEDTQGGITMQMTESEIKTNILQAKDQMKQIPICAQVNACSVDKIKEILRKQGVDLRTLKGEKPTNRGRNWRKKPAPAATSTPNNDKTFLELFNRVNELTAQREAINADLLTIKAELVKIMSAIDKGVDNGETNGQ